MQKLLKKGLVLRQMATKKKRRPISFVLKILAIIFLLFMNLGMIFYTIDTVYEEIIWDEKLSVPNTCEWDMADGNYLGIYNTLWLYRETGEETHRFWRIAYAYEDMFDCITYRQAAKLGLDEQGTDYYAKLAEAALARINEAKAEAELEQDKLVLEFFATEAVEDFPIWPQNK